MANIVDLTLPAVTLSADQISVALELPAITLEVSALVGAVGSLNAELPAVTLETNITEGSSGSVDLTVPAVTLQASVLVGAVGSLEQTLPAVTLQASGRPVKDIALALPAVTLEAFGYTEVECDVDLSLPAVLIDASGVAQAPEGSYAAWVVNARTGQHGQYTNFECFGIFRFNGVWYGLFADGLYELAGAKDGSANIACRVTWAPSNLGATTLKNVELAEVRARRLSSDLLKLGVTTDEQSRRVYTVNLTGQKGMGRHLKKLAKGIEGDLWQFSIENVNGGDLAIAGLVVDADALNV